MSLLYDTNFGLEIIENADIPRTDPIKVCSHHYFAYANNGNIAYFKCLKVGDISSDTIYIGDDIYLEEVDAKGDHLGYVSNVENISKCGFLLKRGHVKEEALYQITGEGSGAIILGETPFSFKFFGSI